MSKRHRLFDLMQMLRRHAHPVSGDTLASEAGVSLRTVYRDIATLQAMGAEIDGEPGVGYVLRPGFLLPPLMFSEEEIQALALGAQWVRRQTDESLAFAAHNALAKIAAVLPAEQRHKIDDNSFHVSRRAPQARTVDLGVLREAMREQRKLRIGYRDEKGSRTERTIWPIMLGFFEARRIIAGWCELRKDFRTFRSDRIASVKLLRDRYPGRRRDLVKQWRARADDERRLTSEAE
jgi:predicted DNA-binding transcriptional regulator YafY